jgi:hypothetical protein
MESAGTAPSSSGSLPERAPLALSAQSRLEAEWFAFGLAAVACLWTGLEGLRGSAPVETWLRFAVTPALLGWGALRLWLTGCGTREPRHRNWGWGPAWLIGQGLLTGGLWLFGQFAAYPALRLADPTDPIGRWLFAPALCVAVAGGALGRPRPGVRPQPGPDGTAPPPRVRAGNAVAAVTLLGSLAVAQSANAFALVDALGAAAAGGTAIALVDRRVLQFAGSGCVFGWSTHALGGEALAPFAGALFVALGTVSHWKHASPCWLLAGSALIVATREWGTSFSAPKLMEQVPAILFLIGLGLTLAALQPQTKRVRDYATVGRERESEWSRVWIGFFLLFVLVRYALEFEQPAILMLPYAGAVVGLGLYDRLLGRR